MPALHEETHDNLNISSGGTVLTFEYTAAPPRMVICKVTLTGIEGGTSYIVRATINGKAVSPISNVTVEAAVTETTLLSREMLLEQSDEVIVTVDGAAGDLAVDTIAVLIDVTPVTEEQLYGTGAILVDHNYGGPDNLKVADHMGAAVQGAVIVVYLKTEYEAGNRGPSFIRGQTSTDVNGRWREELQLDPEIYKLVVTKSGFSLYKQDLTVTA